MARETGQSVEERIETFFTFEFIEERRETRHGKFGMAADILSIDELPLVRPKEGVLSVLSFLSFFARSSSSSFPFVYQPQLKQLQPRTFQIITAITSRFLPSPFSFPPHLPRLLLFDQSNKPLERPSPRRLQKPDLPVRTQVGVEGVKERTVETLEEEHVRRHDEIKRLAATLRIAAVCSAF
jgi:hypothetical protein